MLKEPGQGNTRFALASSKRPSPRGLTTAPTGPSAPAIVRMAVAERHTRRPAATGTTPGATGSLSGCTPVAPAITAKIVAITGP